MLATWYAHSLHSKTNSKILGQKLLSNTIERRVCAERCIVTVDTCKNHPLSC